MNNYHIGKNGPSKCTAAFGKCPYGGENGRSNHFSNLEAASMAYEETMNKKIGGIFGKKKSFYTAHLDEAAAKIKSMKKDFELRDKRQFKDTVNAKLLSMFNEEKIEETLKIDSGLRESGLSYLYSEDGSDKVIGISYGGDFRSEEERGLFTIGEKLKSGEIGKNEVVVSEENGITTFSIIGLGRSSDFEPRRQENLKIAKDRLNNYTSSDEYDLKWKLRNKSVQALRSEAKNRGIKPIPTAKEDVISAIIADQRDPKKLTPSIGEFNNGQVLVIATKNPIIAESMKRLKEAHESGTLRMGSSDNPFSRGIMFYDDRDVSVADKTSQVKKEIASKAARNYVESSKNSLNKFGTVYAASPRVDEDLKDVRDAEYWLNFSPRNGKQIFGMYTKAQLDEMAQKLEEGK